MRDRIEEGRKALVWLRPTGVDVEDEVNEIRGAVLEDFETKKSVTFWDMFKDPIDRRRTIISICATAAYKAYFFTIARVEHPFAMTNVLSTCGLLAIIANALVVVRYGRRRVFLLSGLVLSGCFQLIMAITFDKHPNTVSTGNLLVAISCLFMIAYNGMIAPYSWMVAGEAPSQRLRSYTLGVASAAGYFLAWLITFTAPYFINPSALNWGPRYGYIWFPSCIISAVWTYFYIPELKGRTLEEINQMFHARLSARKFRQFQGATISRKTSQSKADFEGIKVEMLDRA
ncbi:Major facilitator-type transporter ecdD [Colletotrichum sp. SAR11_239]|nr:Major facilitator-type transporter ecdD [Colletotrichum sp. SAR11_239]